MLLRRGGGVLLGMILLTSGALDARAMNMQVPNSQSSREPEGDGCGDGSRDGARGRLVRCIREVNRRHPGEPAREQVERCVDAWRKELRNKKGDAPADDAVESASGGSGVARPLKKPLVPAAGTSALNGTVASGTSTSIAGGSAPRVGASALQGTVAYEAPDELRVYSTQGPRISPVKVPEQVRADQTKMTTQSPERPIAGNKPLPLSQQQTENTSSRPIVGGSSTPKSGAQAPAAGVLSNIKTTTQSKPMDPALQPGSVRAFEEVTTQGSGVTTIVKQPDIPGIQPKQKVSAKPNSPNRLGATASDSYSRESCLDGDYLNGKRKDSGYEELRAQCCEDLSQVRSSDRTIRPSDKACEKDPASCMKRMGCR